MLRRNLKKGTDYTRNAKKKSEKMHRSQMLRRNLKKKKNARITHKMPSYCILLTKVRFSPWERERERRWK